VERVGDKAKPQPGGATRGAQTRKGGCMVSAGFPPKTN
jgi:hypothetical protein